jgi:stress response protein YsnF
VTETDEEAVVAKQARVIEEVVVRKDVAELEQTIANTVRRTKVAVENTGTDVASDRMAGTERTHRLSVRA